MKWRQQAKNPQQGYNQLAYLLWCRCGSKERKTMMKWYQHGEKGYNQPFFWLHPVPRSTTATATK